MRYETFPCPFFNHFMHFLSIPSWLATHMMTLKSLPNLYVPPTLLNITIIGQHTKFPLLLFFPGKPAHHAIYCPTADFGPISTGSADPMLFTAVVTYLTQGHQEPGKKVGF